MSAFGAAPELVAKLGGGSVETWVSSDKRVVVAWLRHPDRVLPGVRYVYQSGDDLALFAGRPFVWSSDDTADGRVTLDARHFLNRDLIRNDIDGWYSIVRYTGTTGTLEVLTDGVGAYPMFEAQARSTTWIGNSAFLVSRVSGRTDVDVDALGRFLTVGWSLGGQPLWLGVKRMSRATLEIRRPGRSLEALDTFPATSIRDLFGKRIDRKGAASTITATVGALADSPGRPNVVPISAGRDSRVVLAAAIAAGVDFTSRTIAFPWIAGFPDTDDVLISGRVVSAVGRERDVIIPGSSGELRWSAALASQVTHGLVSLLETGLIPQPELETPLEIIHSGSGGELARGLAFAGDDPSADEVASRIVGSWIHMIPKPIARPEVVETTRAWIRRWVVEHLELGFAAGDLPDAFWLFERMGGWLAPPQHIQELSNDTTGPLWTRRLLPYSLAGTARERVGEPLHFAILRELAPGLTTVPFDGLNPAWPTLQNPARRARRQRALIAKAVREAHRRLGAFHAQRRGTLNPLLGAARQEIANAREASPDHPIWTVVERRRLERLLERDLYRLDPRSQSTLWRIMTVVAADRRSS